MATVTEEFRHLAKELSDLYQKRKELAKEIVVREDRLRKLGIVLEFADNLEESLQGAFEDSNGPDEPENPEDLQAA